MFHVPRTEAIMWKYRSKEEMEKNAQQLKVRNALRRKWLQGGLEKLAEVPAVNSPSS